MAAGKDRQSLTFGEAAPEGNMENIFNEIREERRRQDEQWGGAEHDDTHEVSDWLDFIDYQMDKISGKDGAVFLKYNAERDALLKIATLAIAAIESYDRKSA